MKITVTTALIKKEATDGSSLKPHWLEPHDHASVLSLRKMRDGTLISDQYLSFLAYGNNLGVALSGVIFYGVIFCPLASGRYAGQKLSLVDVCFTFHLSNFSLWHLIIKVTKQDTAKFLSLFCTFQEFVTKVLCDLLNIGNAYLQDEDWTSAAREFSNGLGIWQDVSETNIEVHEDLLERLYVGRAAAYHRMVRGILGGTHHQDSTHGE